MELYHMINHGIERRDLFLNSGDYIRFIHNLYEFNDTVPAIESARRNVHNLDVGPQRSHIRKRLVEIHGWCLMKDHYHLLLSETIEGGLVKFMMKVNVGYAKYYNERHRRHGHLFQGKTKKILVERHEHFLYILHYLHLNPLDYLPGARKWRERDKGIIPDISKALEHLSKYRWSSYLDYCGTQNFPSILKKSLFEKALETSYVSAIQEYLADRTIEMRDTKSLEY